MTMLNKILAMIACAAVLYTDSNARSLRKHEYQARHRGSTAIVSIANNIVKKQIIKHANLGILEREIYWLQKLEKCSFTPKLLSFDTENKTLTMTYVGRKVTKKNLPKDWKAQVEHIISALDIHQCCHNDISQPNILIQKGKINLIDFGWATTNDQKFSDILPSGLRCKNSSAPNVSNRKALYKAINKVLREPFLITH